MPVNRLKRFLDQNHVPFTVIPHTPAYTGLETAQAAHEPGGEFAKTVMLKIDENLVMVVIPADHVIDLNHLQHDLGARSVSLAAEEEFAQTFPDCETGAMPPLGELYNVEVFIDESFALHQMISFNAGTHQEIIKMKYSDFRRFTRAKPLGFLLVYTRE